jgi:hypothetical protein
LAASEQLVVWVLAAPEGLRAHTLYHDHRIAIAGTPPVQNAPLATRHTGAAALASGE